jgi:hypothetical protein
MAVKDFIPEPAALTCEECLEASDEDARGWIALLTEDVDGIEPIGVAVFCPECARVEFGYRAEGWGEEPAS